MATSNPTPIYTTLTDVTWWDRRMVLFCMHIYGWLKWMLNRYRYRPGRTVCDGWKDAQCAIARARPCQDETSMQPSVPF